MSRKTRTTSSTGEASEDSTPPVRDVPRAGLSLEAELAEDICAEQLYLKLQLLDYEQWWCRQRQPPALPLGRLHFITPPPSGLDAFPAFASLAAWLLGVAGAPAALPRQPAHPNASLAALMAAAQQLGFAPPSYPPDQLHAGWGPRAAAFLDGLAEAALARSGFAWGPPAYRPAGAGSGMPEVPEGIEEATAAEDEAADDDEGGGDAAGGGFAREDAWNLPAGLPSEGRVLQSRVDPTAWRLEAERLAPRLRTAPGGGADLAGWRAHVARAGSARDAIAQAWPSAGAGLARLGSEVGAHLERVEGREAVLEAQHAPSLARYQQLQAELAAAQEQHHGRLQALSDGNARLERVGAELARVRGAVDARTSALSDATPLVRAQALLRSLRAETVQMDVRIGVLSHTLMQKSLQARSKQHAAAAAAHTAVHGMGGAAAGGSALHVR